MKFTLPKTILLAAGHGGKDSGAVSPDKKHNERDQAIFIVDTAADILRKAGHVVEVVPHKLDTHEAIPWINKKFNWGDAWAFEIHRDSGKREEPDASLRCGVYHGSSAISAQLAFALVTGMEFFGAVPSSWSRDQKESRFNRLGWIAQPETLSHLIELGFMEGRNDTEHLTRLANIFADALHRTITEHS